MGKPAKTGKQQVRGAKGRFLPGKSGNPSGRPAGSRHRATVAAQELLNGEAEGLVRKAVDLALDGDTVALRLCLERLVPPRRDSPIKIDLPSVESAKDVSEALSFLLGSLGRGELTPTEAQVVAGLLDAHRRALELGDLEERLAALEKNLDGRSCDERHKKKSWAS